MSAGALRLRVVTPTHELELKGVTHLRFDAEDGARGILFGHERATERLLEGAVYVRTRVADEQTRDHFVATEGGFAVISPTQVVMVSPWAERADTISELAHHVRAREARRSHINREARLLAQQRELDLRRALARLKREVSW